MSYSVNPYNFRASLYYVDPKDFFVTALETLVPITTLTPPKSSLDASGISNLPIPIPALTQAVQSVSSPVQQVLQVFQTVSKNKLFEGEFDRRLANQRLANNQLLTQNRLNEALDRSQALQIQPNQLNSLKLLNAYFNELADVALQSSAGKLKAISAQQIRAIAALEGDANQFGLSDVLAFLRQQQALPTGVEQARKLERSELMIQRMNAPLSPLPVEARTAKTDNTIERNPAAEAISSNKKRSMQTQQDMPSGLPLLLQNEDASLAEMSNEINTEISALFGHSEEGLSKANLTELLKNGFTSIQHLESHLAQLSPTAPQAESLKCQLVGTRRLYLLAVFLKDHFHALAIPKTGEEGSEASIRLETLVKLQQRNQQPPLSPLL